MQKQDVQMGKKPLFRSLALFLTCFFFLASILTAFVLVPYINHAFEKQHIHDSRITLDIETDFFKRFVQNHISLARDFVSLPVVVDAVYSGDTTNPDLRDALANFKVIDGRGRITLQNARGDILNKLQGMPSADSILGASEMKDMLNNGAPYYFKLLNQSGNDFSFLLSLPVQKNGEMIGFMNARVTVPITTIFSLRAMDDGGTFKLEQGDVTIKMAEDHILLPREISHRILFGDVILTYIADDVFIVQEQNRLRNIMLAILFSGLAISFVLFSVLGYRTFSGEHNSQSVERAPWRSYSLAFLIGVIGVLASISAFFVVAHLKNQRVENLMFSDARVYTGEIRNALNKNLEALGALKAFYQASSHVSRDDFKTFTELLLKQNSGIQALEWVPYVSKSERSKYEAAAVKDALLDFEFKEKSVNGELVRAGFRDSYYPVYYLEPYVGNERALGLDLSLNKARLSAIHKARDTGETVASAPVDLVQGVNGSAGVLVFSAVYKMTEDQRGSFKGLVLVVLRVSDVLKLALRKGYDHDFLLVEDVTNPDNAVTLWGSHQDVSNAFYGTTLDVGGRQWRITIFSNLGDIYSQDNWVSWLVLMFGIVFSFFIVYALIQLIRRGHVIESIVEDRTQEILDARHFQDLILSSIPDLLFIKDENFRIVEANASFLNLYPPEVRGQVIGATTLEKYDKNEAEEFLKYDRLALDEGYSQVEETLTFPNGKTRTMFTKKVRFEDLSGKRFILGVARDVTEMKEAEADILRSNTELERFAHVASHDMKEPLRMVKNFTQLLKDKYAPTLDETANQYIDFAHDGAARMEDLVNDLLEYARVGNEFENSKNVNLNDIMVLIQGNLKESLEDSGAKIIYDELPTVYANSVRLVRVLQNLIGNGIKYQTKDTAPEIHIKAVEKGGIWLVSVQDNGIGIKEEYIDKIFDPFKRLHAKSEYSGTGMGLTIAQKIVEGFGGRIWVKSEFGEGSTFYFTLPPERDA